MNFNERNQLSSYLKEIKDRYHKETRRMSQLRNYSSMRLRVTRSKDGRDYYYLFMPEEKRYKYIGAGTNEDVVRIKETQYLQKSISELKREIRLIENVLRSSRDLSYDSINNMLNKAYKGAPIPYAQDTARQAKEWKEKAIRYKDSFPPFKPEELIVMTRDGTLVRSRGEALIYNYLLEIGATFVYELPLRIRMGNKDSLLLPDFTILSEYDYKTIKIIEHQGLMDDPKYRNGFNDKVYKYWSNNYLPERDVFFTFDLPNGGFDDTPVRSIVHRYIRPFTMNEATHF